MINSRPFGLQRDLIVHPALGLAVDKTVLAAGVDAEHVKIALKPDNSGVSLWRVPISRTTSCTESSSSITLAESAALSSAWTGAGSSRALNISQTVQSLGLNGVLTDTGITDLLVLPIAVITLTQPLLGFVLELATQQTAGIVRHSTQPLL